uniref:Uncharacterized protein n=1 Tax=Rhizophora mucronata TaxID=61149 RepID=A0A2P2NLB9_RHIMU
MVHKQEMNLASATLKLRLDNSLLVFQLYCQLHKYHTLLPKF